MFENIENLNKTASMAVSAFGIEGKAVFVQISENATYFICQNTSLYTHSEYADLITTLLKNWKVKYNGY